MLHLVIKVNEEGGGSGAGGGEGGRRVKQTLLVFFIPHILFTTFKMRNIKKFHHLCFMYIYLTKSRGSFSFSITAFECPQ